jgi:cell division protein FtsB
MMNTTGSRSDNRTLRRLGIAALVVVCAVLVMNEIFGGHGLLALRRQRREYESLEQQIRDLERQNLELQKQIKALKSDPQAIEKQAREELHLARPGETIYMLPEKDSKSGPPPAAQNTSPKP